jgi:hypothetical protein
MPYSQPPTFPSFVRRALIRTRLIVLSKLSTGLAYIRVCHLGHEGTRQYHSLFTICCTAVGAGRRSATPNSSSVCVKRQDSVVTADLRGVVLK